LGSSGMTKDQKGRGGTGKRIRSGKSLPSRGLGSLSRADGVAGLGLRKRRTRKIGEIRAKGGASSNKDPAAYWGFWRLKKSALGKEEEEGRERNAGRPSWERKEKGFWGGGAVCEGARKETQYSRLVLGAGNLRRGGGRRANGGGEGKMGGGSRGRVDFLLSYY